MPSIQPGRQLGWITDSATGMPEENRGLIAGEGEGIFSPVGSFRIMGPPFLLQTRPNREGGND
jgi:hypothetical protein